MKVKSLLFSILAAAALLVSCNNDPQEVVVVSDENPNIDGTWVYTDNDDEYIYKLTVSGTTITAEYTYKLGFYDSSNAGALNSTTSQSLMTRTFENCVIKTSDLGYTTASFIYDYAATIYPQYNSYSSKTAYVKYVFDEFSYEVINSCLVIYDTVETPTIDTNDYYDAINLINYTDFNGGIPMIPAGVYYKE